MVTVLLAVERLWLLATQSYRRAIRVRYGSFIISDCERNNFLVVFFNGDLLVLGGWWGEYAEVLHSIATMSTVIDIYVEMPMWEGPLVIVYVSLRIDTHGHHRAFSIFRCEFNIASRL